MRVPVSALALLAAVTAACAQSPAAISPQPSFGRVVSISANLGALGLTIPADFVGVSFETQIMTNGGYLNTNQTSLVGLMSLLGTSGTVRVGGISGDQVTAPALTQPMANNLASFVAALGAGWSVFYTLNAKINDSAIAAAQALLLANALGSKVTFAYGNEPIGSGNYTTGTYPTMWNTYDTAVLAAVPGAKRISTDDGNWGQIQTVVPALTPGVAGLAAIAYHWYGTPCGTVQTALKVLSSVPFAKLSTSGAVNFSMNTTFAGSTPQRLTESNTICGGTNTPSGSTDRMMGAAWYLSEAITLASLGYTGIDTHEFIGATGWPLPTGPGPQNNAYYNPLWLNANGSFQAGAVFYGLYLFSKIAGQQIAPVAIGGNGSVQAIATQRTAGKANILVVNTDVTNPTSIAVDQTSAWSTATVLTMSGASCSDAAPTLGGAAIGESGAWSGAPFSISNGQSITLPPCGAALVSVQ